jgi:hypothetical protein
MVTNANVLEARRKSLPARTKVPTGSGQVATPGAVRRRRAVRTALGWVVVTLALGASPAFADPPRPTDYRSEIVSVTPEVERLVVSIVGGDAFIDLDAGGHVVAVPGYQGEPYLRFDADGTVSENVRSPAHFLNTSRYSETVVPPEADPEAEPEWQVVARSGRYAWHDHRTHWMLEVPPTGLGPGDQILDSIIPITVDGQAVEIAVVSVWMAPPSRAPWIVAGVLAAVLGAIGAAYGGRRARVVVAMVLVAAAAALTVGLWQTWSLPSETGPPFIHWVLPLSALVVAAAALVPRWSAFAVRSLTLVASVQLVVWTVLRLDVLNHAILPTSAPFWLDRSLTAGVGVLAVVAVYATGVSIVRLMYPAATSGDGPPAAPPAPLTSEA